MSREGDDLRLVKGVNAPARGDPNAAFAVFEESQNKVRREAFFSAKSIHMTAVDVIDASIRCSNPQPPVTIQQ